MKRKKQTALDKLIMDMGAWATITADEETEKIIATVMEVLKKAKSIEKQQIIEAYDHMRRVGDFENGEQYFNDTFY